MQSRGEALWLGKFGGGYCKEGLPRAGSSPRALPRGSITANAAMQSGSGDDVLLLEGFYAVVTVYMFKLYL